MATSTFSPPHQLPLKPQLGPKPGLLLPRLRASPRLRLAAAAAAGEAPVEAPPKPAAAADPSPAASNGAAAAVKAEAAAVKIEESASPRFNDSRWVNGTWDLDLFGRKAGAVDWDAVIDAEARRRKWLEDFPEASSSDEAVVFDTSIIPWWAWIKRFHLPEAEKLNGRAAMVGFFMAYFVDSLTGVGLVDQMGNFFCKTLLFVAVAGVLLVRKNEDIDSLKKLIDESTFYDKQWQSTWQEDSPSVPKK